LIGDDTDDPRLQEIFERTVAVGHGHVPNLYRTLGNAPDMLRSWITFAWSLRNDPVTPRALRELVIVRVATVLGSEYELTHHRPMAIEAGCSAEQIDHLGDWRSHTALYDADALAALAVADRIAVGDPIEPAEWADLRDHFEARACVEIALTASFYVCVGRLIDAFDLPLDAPIDEPSDT